MDEHADLAEVVAHLAERIEALEAENQRLRVAVGPSPSPVVEPPATADREVTRRRLMRGAAGAAVAGAVGAVAIASPAAANADGGSFTLGEATNTATHTTGVTATLGSAPVLHVTNASTNGYGVHAQVHGTSGITLFGGGVLGESSDLPGVVGTTGTSAGVVGVTGGSSGSAPPPAGVAGDSAKQVGVSGSSHDAVGVKGTSATTSGVHGYVGTSGFSGRSGVLGEASDAYGTSGFSSSRSGVRAASNSAEGIKASSTSHIGGAFSGGRAAINLAPTSSAGRPTTGAHGKGDIVLDSAGALFICTVGGLPGTWVRVNVSPA